MIVVLGLAIAYAAGVEPRRLILLGAALFLPLVFAVLVAVHWVQGRPDNVNKAALLCEGVASELRAGATLRDAVTNAAVSVGMRAPSSSSHETPITEVSAQVAEDMPSIAEALLLTVGAASRSGSDAAALFDEIGSLAIARAEIRHEVRVATAPGKATAAVLVGAPVIYLLSRVGSGALSAHLGSSQQRVVASIGLGLFLLGLATAGFVLWRAAR